MRIHDISTLIHPDMIVYKNKEDKKPIITVVSDYNRGTSYESRALFRYACWHSHGCSSSHD